MNVVTESEEFNPMKTPFLILLFSGALCAQFRFTPWHSDKWTGAGGTVIKYDKAEHLVGAGLLEMALFFALPKGTKKYSVPIALGAGLIWEVKDGFLDHRRYGWIGAEGFSFKDLIADAVGVSVFWGLRKLLNRRKNEKNFDDALAILNGGA